MLIPSRERIVELIPRMLRFGVVGVSNTVVDLAVLNALLYLFASTETHAMLFPFFATAGFIAATLNSYFWNRSWTFHAEDGHVSRDLPRFYLVTIVSFLVNVGLSSFLVWLAPFPMLSQTLWANVAKLFATGVSLALNFIGYQKLVFKDVEGK